MIRDKDGWKFPLAFQQQLSLSKDAHCQVFLPESRENNVSNFIDI